MMSQAQVLSWCNQHACSQLYPTGSHFSSFVINCVANNRTSSDTLPRLNYLKFITRLCLPGCHKFLFCNNPIMPQIVIWISKLDRLRLSLSFHATSWFHFQLDAGPISELLVWHARFWDAWLRLDVGTVTYLWWGLGWEIIQGPI